MPIMNISKTRPLQVSKLNFNQELTLDPTPVNFLFTSLLQEQLLLHNSLKSNAFNFTHYNTTHFQVLIDRYTLLRAIR